MRKNVGPNFPVLVKFTPVHKVEGGRELDEGLEMARILEEAGIDALHVDVGCYEAWHKAISTVYEPEGHQMEVVAAVKQAVTVPVLGQGKMFDPARAEQAVAEGKTDYIVLGHQMLADPYWPKKVQEGRLMDITPCIGCNECLLAGFSGKHYYCAVNPLCYAEDTYGLPKPDGTRRSVLVIGGGPGGMSAAIAAAKRGFDVDLWEKSSRLGGNLWAAGMPTFKHDVLRLITYMERQVLKLGVNVVLNKEASAANVLAGKTYDKVILAAGSTAVMPPIPGIENAAAANDYLLGLKKPGKKVVVIGGGLVGCETAAYMKETAEEVTIVEMLHDILAMCDHCLNNDQALRTMIKEREIAVAAGARVKEITNSSVVYEQDGQEHTLSCDTVIIAAGYRSNNRLADELDGKVKDLTVIGDAEMPRKILTAIHEGYHAIRVME